MNSGVWQSLGLAALTVSFLAGRIALGQNLSPNPGFENWTDGQPDEWIVFGVGPDGSCDDCVLSQDTNIFRSGTSSLRTEAIPGPYDFGFPGVVAPVAQLDAGDYDPGDEFYGEVWVYDGQQENFEDRSVFIEIKFVPEWCDGSDSCVEKHRPSITADDMPDNEWVKLTVTSPPIDDFISSVEFAVFNFTNGSHPKTAF